MKKKVAVLGATGSIGRNTLDVIRTAPDAFEPVLFIAGVNAAALAEIAAEFPNAKTILASVTNDAGQISAAIAGCGADIAINGIAGAAGLRYSLDVLDAGIDLALANKETIVMAAPLVFKKAQEKNTNVIPVDSEHSAIFNLINAHGADLIQEIILTASGGPFRTWTQEQLKNVTLKDALAHPTWSMGNKITIDSASLANKGLEVIEAARLFNVQPQQIKVVIHTQSIVHSMVRLKNGAVYAQLSNPDMRLPIHDALHYPEMAAGKWGTLNFDNLTLTFEKPDTVRFPMLELAYDSLKSGGLYTTAYNAANEEAVAAFTAGKIPFLEINSVTRYVLDNDFSGDDLNLAEILAADEKARKTARKYMEKKC